MIQTPSNIKKGERFYCPHCNHYYVRGRTDIRCAALHGADDCCHYTDRQLENKNTCPRCFKDNRLERKHYDMMWGEAELWCRRCKIKVRDMDFG